MGGAAGQAPVANPIEGDDMKRSREIVKTLNINLRSEDWQLLKAQAATDNVPLHEAIAAILVRAA
jgi:hypothetical protein